MLGGVGFFVGVGKRIVLSALALGIVAYSYRSASTT